MLYNFKNLEPITETSILNKTTEYDIYSYYIGHRFTVGSKFNSPLRKDNNPSFGIFVSKVTRQLLFKDQSTGESGNCFKFVQLKEHLTTYKEALEKVNEDLNLGLLKSSTEGLKIKTTYKASRTSIQVKLKNFTSIDDDYWTQFNIDRDVLKLFKVRPISHVWVNNSLLPWRYEKDNPMYAYQVYNKFKIYRPYSKENTKWLTNCTSVDIQGYEQLPEKGNLLIITKSLKDVMVLYTLGYSAISVNSENTLLPKKVFNDLISRFTNIVLFFDNDSGGIAGRNKMVQEYSIPYIEIPDKETKDISDYIKVHKKTKTTKFLKNILKDVHITKNV